VNLEPLQPVARDETRYRAGSCGSVYFGIKGCVQQDVFPTSSKIHSQYQGLIPGPYAGKRHTPIVRDPLPRVIADLDKVDNVALDALNLDNPSANLNISTPDKPFSAGTSIGLLTPIN